MVGRILTDYWRGMNLARVKNAFRNRDFLMFLIYMVVFRTWDITDFSERWHGGAVTWWLFMLCGVFLLLASFLAALFPNQLPEIMFFLPVEKKERKRYVVTAYWLRVVLGGLPIFVLNFVLYGMGVLHIVRLLGNVGMTVLMLAAWNLQLEGVNIDDWYPAKKKELGGYGVWSMIARVMSYIIYMVQFGMTYEDIYAIPYDNLDMGLELAAAVIFLFGIFHYGRPTMRIAQEFESMEAINEDCN